MTGVDTAYDALHGEKKRSLWKRLEMLGIIFLMSGGWFSVGYVFGVRLDNQRYEALQTKQAAAIERLKSKQAKELAEARKEASTTLGNVAEGMAAAANSTAKAAQALIDANDKPKKGK